MAVEPRPLNAEQLAFVAHVQAVAVKHRRWIGEHEELRALLQASVGPKGDPELVSYTDPRLQAELQTHRDVALWQGSDRRFRLISLQSPKSVAAAVIHAENDPGPDTCRFCLINEARTPLELEMVKDGAGSPINNVKVHPRCRLAWRRVERIAMQNPAFAKSRTPQR